jgi:hypothetical protein
MGLVTGLDGYENLSYPGFRTPHLPSSSQPLNRIRYTQRPSINTQSKMKAAKRDFINLPLESFAKIRRIISIFVRTIGRVSTSLLRTYGH